MVKKIVCILALILCIGAAAGAVVSAKRVSSGANIPYAYELQDDIANEGKIAKIDIISSYTWFNNIVATGIDITSGLTDVDGVYHMSLVYSKSGEFQSLFEDINTARKEGKEITVDDPITLYGVMKRPFDGVFDEEGSVLPIDASDEQYERLRFLTISSATMYKGDTNLDWDQIQSFMSDEDWRLELGLYPTGTQPPKQRSVLSLVLIGISTLSFIVFVIALLMVVRKKK